MPESTDLLLFAGAAVALLIIPGPAVLYIVTRSVAQGRVAGLTSVVGVHAGSLVHVAAAAFGLSALLASSATAFSVVKYLGAAYLVWLGIRQFRRRVDRDAAGVEPPPGYSPARIFGEGVLVNVLNPKTAIFFLAFLPQFVDPGRGPVAVQMVLLGCCFIGLGMLTDGGYAVLAGSLADRIRRSPRSRRRLDRVGGVVYVGLGVGAAASAPGT